VCIKSGPNHIQIIECSSIHPRMRVNLWPCRKLLLQYSCGTHADGKATPTPDWKLAHANLLMLICNWLYANTSCNYSNTMYYPFRMPLLRLRNTAEARCMEILLEPLLRATAGRAAWNTPNVVGPTMLWRHVYLNRLSCQRTSQVPALISTRGHEAYY